MSLFLVNRTKQDSLQRLEQQNLLCSLFCRLENKQGSPSIWLQGRALLLAQARCLSVESSENREQKALLLTLLIDIIPIPSEGGAHDLI